MATCPLTGVPAALAAVALLELAMLGDADPLAPAQRPGSAPEGLTIACLLAFPVFEHFLDFVCFAVLLAGLYALLRSRIARKC